MLYKKKKSKKIVRVAEQHSIFPVTVTKFAYQGILVLSSFSLRLSVVVFADLKQAGSRLGQIQILNQLTFLCQM